MGQESWEDLQRALSDPQSIHAMCEDYRAGLGIDRRYDDEDRAAGRRVQCPALVLWGTKSDPLTGIWQSWVAGELTAKGIGSGHHALHTTAAHTRFLVDEKQAHYLLVVKANQPALFATLRALHWQQATARFYERGSGHGRQETRSVRALTVADLGLGFRHASPQRIGQLARSEWGIEAVHHVRDVTFAEDASKIRTGHGPENMAALRNLAINTLRDAGHRSIAAGLREVSCAAFTRPLEHFGLA